MGAKYSYKWCGHFADQASIILGKKSLNFFWVLKMWLEEISQSPMMTSHQSPMTSHQSPMTSHQSPC